MINLFTNLILFILRLLNMVTFGILDNLAVVYGVLVLATFYAVVKLDKYFKICDFWRSSGFFIKTLVFTGVLFNALPQWYLWIIGSILVVLAYFLKPLKTKKSSLFQKIKNVIVEEFKEGDFKLKNETQTVSKNTGTKPVKKLPPVEP